MRRAAWTIALALSACKFETSPVPFPAAGAASGNAGNGLARVPDASGLTPPSLENPTNPDPSPPPPPDPPRASDAGPMPDAAQTSASRAAAVHDAGARGTATHDAGAADASMREDAAMQIAAP